MKKNVKITNKLNLIKINFGIGKDLLKLAFDKIGLNNKKYLLNIKTSNLIQINNSIKKIESGKKLIDSIKCGMEFRENIKSYKGIRHKLRYPIRGQRTHTNAKTAKKSIFKKGI